MRTVGAYEAKTHLSELLDRVEQGEQIEITRHGVVVAVLQPPEVRAGGSVAEAIAGLRAFRGRHALSAQELADFTREGRDE